MKSLAKNMTTLPRNTAIAPLDDILSPLLPAALQVQRGARAFLTAEYKWLSIFVVAVSAFLVGVLEGQSSAPAGSVNKGGWQTLICFIVGAVLSASAGWAGKRPV